MTMEMHWTTQHGVHPSYCAACRQMLEMTGPFQWGIDGDGSGNPHNIRGALWLDKDGNVLHACGSQEQHVSDEDWDTLRLQLQNLSQKR